MNREMYLVVEQLPAQWAKKQKLDGVVKILLKVCIIR